MKREEFMAATPSGPRLVQAATTKHLAVHKGLGGDEIWAVSHRPIGCRMGYWEKRRDAVAAAKALESKNAADLEALADIPFAVGARPVFKGKQLAANKRLRKAVNALGRIEA